MEKFKRDARVRVKNANSDFRGCLGVVTGYDYGTESPVPLVMVRIDGGSRHGAHTHAFTERDLAVSTLARQHPVYLRKDYIQEQ
jgi:hypothetical protein